MSRHYEMSVEITAHRPDRADAIQDAATDEWAFIDWYDQGDTLTASAEGSLCCGEGENEFADRLAAAIWKANGAYCAVTVRATYLENPPCEQYGMDENDYARLIRQQQER